MAARPRQVFLVDYARNKNTVEFDARASARCPDARINIDFNGHPPSAEIGPNGSTSHFRFGSAQLLGAQRGPDRLHYSAGQATVPGVSTDGRIPPVDPQAISAGMDTETMGRSTPCRTAGSELTGYNLVAVDPNTGAPLEPGVRYVRRRESARLVKRDRTLPAGTVVAAAAKDEASRAHRRGRRRTWSLGGIEDTSRYRVSPFSLA
jgi:hypothetical protein